jgi:hypothetical protein
MLESRCSVVLRYKRKSLELDELNQYGDLCMPHFAARV